MILSARGGWTRNWPARIAIVLLAAAPAASVGPRDPDRRRPVDGATGVEGRLLDRALSSAR